jgi:signal peptidase I
MSAPSTDDTANGAADGVDSVDGSKNDNSVPAPPSSWRQAASLLLTIVGVVIAVLLVQAYLIKPFTIPSASMEPTLQPGDLVLVNRLTTHLGGPKDGDIVVFYAPAGAESETCGDPSQGANSSSMCSIAASPRTSTYYIKRVEGVPGDKLSLRNGKLYRNGKLVNEPYTRPCNNEIERCNFPTTITVPAGHYFMMGDNRSNSDDSRFWGAVPRSWIVGKAIILLWPISRWNIF